jgi:23S rRNA pseudouridine1911/1915/1917 synthase
LEAGERRTQVKLVHRLDAGTSGVLVLARTPMAAKNLGAAFAGGACQKVYVALCSGCFADPREVDAPIARHRGVQHAVRTDGKAAATLFEPMASHETFSLIRAFPRTGRTHQIRVHLAHIGHPILGDRLYGGPGYVGDPPPAAVGRPMLHALELVVPHPKSGEPLRLTVPPPADFSDLAARLGLVQFNTSVHGW